MKELSKAEILALFEEINMMLAEMNKHGDILLVGGAALALVHDARVSTYDVDAIFQPSEEMRRIIKLIAERRGLKDDWLNDGAKGFMTPRMQGSQEVFYEYSHLTISNLNAECLLAMKLTSARALTKDMDDSVFLMKKLQIQNEDELFDIIEKYTDKDRHTPRAKYFTLEAFERYSVEIDSTRVPQEKPSILEALRKKQEKVNQTQKNHHQEEKNGNIDR